MEAIKTALEQALYEVAIDVLESLKTLAFHSSRGMQAADLVKAKVAEVLRHIQQQEEEVNDLERLLEETLENA